MVTVTRECYFLGEFGTVIKIMVLLVPNICIKDNDTRNLFGMFKGDMLKKRCFKSSVPNGHTCLRACPQAFVYQLQYNIGSMKTVVVFYSLLTFVHFLH